MGRHCPPSPHQPHQPHQPLSLPNAMWTHNTFIITTKKLMPRNAQITNQQMNSEGLAGRLWSIKTSSDLSFNAKNFIYIFVLTCTCQYVTSPLVWNISYHCILHLQYLINAANDAFCYFINISGGRPQPPLHHSRVFRHLFIPQQLIILISALKWTSCREDLFDKNNKAILPAGTSQTPY